MPLHCASLVLGKVEFPLACTKSHSAPGHSVCLALVKSPELASSAVIHHLRRAVIVHYRAGRIGRKLRRILAISFEARIVLLDKLKHICYTDIGGIQ